MTSTRQVVATFTQERANGDWGADDHEHNTYLVGVNVLAGPGAPTPLSGGPVYLHLLVSEAGDALVVAAESMEARLDQRTRKRLANLPNPGDFETIVLVVGRTGVGKSSLINSIVGSRVAQAGEFEPTTAAVHLYEGSINGSPILLVDTPGFADAHLVAGQDQVYMELIHEFCPEGDLILFVTEIDAKRIDRAELDTLAALHRGFPQAAWEHLIIVMTGADRVFKRDYQRVYANRAAVLQQALVSQFGEVAAEIPFQAVSHSKTRTPDSRLWLGDLWILMLLRMDSVGFRSFALSALTRLSISEITDESAEPHPYELDDVMIEDVDLFVDDDWPRRDEEPDVEIDVLDSHSAPVQDVSGSIGSGRAERVDDQPSWSEGRTFKTPRNGRRTSPFPGSSSPARTPSMASGDPIQASLEATSLQRQLVEGESGVQVIYVHFGDLIGQQVLVSGDQARSTGEIIREREPTLWEAIRRLWKGARGGLGILADMAGLGWILN